MNTSRDTTAPEQAPAAGGGAAGGLIFLFFLFFLFLALVALTLGELVLTTVVASHQERVTGLAGLAMMKGALILWFFMHLRRQPRWLRRTVILPLLLSASFLVILMLDGVVRLGGGP